MSGSLLRVGLGLCVCTSTVVSAPGCPPAGHASQDFEAGNLYGLEKFWAFHHYTGLPQGSGLDIDPKVLTRFRAGLMYELVIRKPTPRCSLVGAHLDLSMPWQLGLWAPRGRADAQWKGHMHVRTLTQSLKPSASKIKPG